MTDLLKAIKERSRAAWASGDYSVIGAMLVPVSESLCEAVRLRAGQQVLDVATGTGNTALAAARRFCDVTGVDFVPAWLERAQARAAAERLPATFVAGDAEELPFADGSFDVVLSTFGCMFAPDQEKAAAELMRVCRPGGRIALASWTPEGFVGQMFQVIARYAPAPPPELKSALLWGNEARLRQLFGAGNPVQATRRMLQFRYRSVEHAAELNRRHNGQMIGLYSSLDPAAQTRLDQDVADFMRARNQSGDDSLLMPAEYLEAVITKGSPAG